MNKVSVLLVNLVLLVFIFWCAFGIANALNVEVKEVIVEKEVISDGKSFYSLLTGTKYEPRKAAFVHYDPKWGKALNQYRNQFVRTVNYKLYQDGRFFNLTKDILERTPLNMDSLLENELLIKSTLESELKKHPIWNENE